MCCAGRRSAGLELVPPTWHRANPNLQVDGVPIALDAAHSKQRRDGYRAQVRSGADRDPPWGRVWPASGGGGRDTADAGRHREQRGGGEGKQGSGS